MLSLTREREGPKAVSCPSLFSGPNLPSFTLIVTEGLTTIYQGYPVRDVQPCPEHPLKMGEGQVQAKLEEGALGKLSLTIRSTWLDTEGFTTGNTF